MTKRILSFLLALAMLVSVLPALPAAAAAPGQISKGDAIPAHILRPMSEGDEAWTEEQRNAPILELGVPVDVTLSFTQTVYFRFIPEKTDVYTFSASSGSDTFATLTSEDRSLQLYDDNSGEGDDFAVTALLTAGQTYYLLACYYYTFLQGSFSVTMETTHGYAETLVPATCTEDGLRTQVCEHCGDTRSEVLPAGHLWESGICTACGETFYQSGTCGDDLRWELDHLGNLTISGTGSTWDYAPFDVLYGSLYHNIDESYYTTGPAPWAPWYQDIRTLTLSEGISSIGYYTFWGLIGLTELNVPEGVTSIAYAAFAFCPELRSIVLPSTLKEMDICFEYCASLSGIRFEGPVPRRGNMALSTVADDLQVFYRSSRGSWQWAMENWDAPEGTRWFDMDTSVSPEEFAFAQEACTMEAGSCVQLTSNADDYVLTLLTQWDSSDPGVAYVSDTGLVTGLQPGTAEITLRSDDGAYCATCTVTVTGTAYTDSGMTELAGTFGYNLSENDYEVWDDLAASFLTITGGTLERIQYVSGTGVVISRYNEKLAMLSEQVIEPELPIFGGFFAGENWNFLLYGQKNMDESNDQEVLRIVRYSKDWQRMDHCSIFGINTTIPFDAGCADFAEANGVLYLHTSHEMYTSEDGSNHQANMTFALDQQSMTVVDQWYDVMNISYGYVSHSFSQRVRTTEQYVFRVDHGDAHPRAIVLTRAETGGKLTSVNDRDLLKIPGRTGENYTGVSLGGFELSSGSCLVAGNSVELSGAYNHQGHRNIFLCVADQDLTRSDTVWITDYTQEDQIRVHTPQLVKVAEDLFVLLWEQSVRYGYATVVNTYALVVTAAGEPVSEIVELDCRLSDCQPVVTGDGLVSWYAADQEHLRLYQLSWQQLIQDPDAVKAVLGHRYTATIIEPTCTAEGYTTHTCANCGHSYTDTPTPMWEHELSEWTIVNAPSCGQRGLEKQTCLLCGEAWTRETEPGGHDYVSEITEATCEAQGYTTLRCETCGYWERTDYVEPLGHSFAEWYVHTQTTCVAPGLEKRTCNRCYHYEEERVIPQLDHVYIGEVTEPTCLSQGFTTYRCDGCISQYVGDYTEALGHDFGEWFTVIEATCTDEGEERHECKRCLLLEARSTPLGDHKYSPEVTSPTCTEQGYTTYHCVCGEEYVADFVPVSGHNWDQWYTVTEATCTEAGLERRGCPGCEATENRMIPATGHSYTAVVTKPTCTNGGYTTHTCRCGDSYTTDPTEPTGHNHTIMVIQPFCISAGFTEWRCDCGDSYIAEITPPLGHDWGELRCNRCGEAREKPFADVAEKDFFYESVLWAVGEGITSGTGNGAFSPNASCTRAQVVTFLWRAMGQPAPESRDNPFTDVTEGSYFYDAVLWAVEQGITSGTAPGVFSPNASCTRAQVVTFLWRTMGKKQPEQTENPFADVVGGSYFYDAVLWAVEEKITSGTSATTFDPNAPCTRAQVVTFLFRAME